MGRRKGPTRTGRAAVAAVAAAAVLMALSLAVRWGGIAGGTGAAPESFSIQVLNGTGEAGLAHRVTMDLRRLGIDVLLEGNAERFDFAESVLVDRRGNEELMRRLQRRLGVRRVVVQVKQGSLVDVTLVVGRDRDRLRLRP